MKLKFYLIKALLCATALTTSYGMENDPDCNRQGMKRISPDTGFNVDSEENRAQKKAHIKREDEQNISPLSAQELEELLDETFKMELVKEDLVEFNNDGRATWDQEKQENPNNFNPPAIYSLCKNYFIINWHEIEKQGMNNYKYAQLYIQLGPNEWKSNLSQHVTREATSNNNNPEANYVLGCMYLTGRGGVACDRDKAIEFLIKAVEKEFLPAAFLLSSMYGEVGVTTWSHQGYENDKKRFYYMNFAATKGYIPAIHYLGAKFNIDGAITTLEKEISGLIRYKSADIINSSFQSFDFSLINTMQASIADLANPCSIYSTLSNPYNVFQDTVLNSGHLHNLFLKLERSVNTWESILEGIQSDHKNLLLTCLIPTDEEIKKELLGATSNGISAYDYEGTIYLSDGKEATALSHDIMKMVGKNGTIDQIINSLKKHNQLGGHKMSLDEFIAEVHFKFSTTFKKLSVNKLIDQLTQLEKLLVSFIKDHAYERNQAFIKKYPISETDE